MLHIMALTRTNHWVFIVGHPEKGYEQIISMRIVLLYPSGDEVVLSEQTDEHTILSKAVLLSKRKEWLAQHPHRIMQLCLIVDDGRSYG
jgi:hypothetical protein